MDNTIDTNRIPQHIAIIMDGNGRWAKARGLNRSMGHQQGVASVHEITAACSRLGVKFLTLYTFSTENWNRPADEVAALMALLLHSLEEELFMKNNVRLRVIGDLSRVPQEVVDAMNGLMQRIAAEVKAGTLSPDAITEDVINSHLVTNFMPDPELLIRTGGELRLSNYLLWQCAYSELYFCPTYWPDFNEAELRKALLDYQSRERRFGKTSEQVKPSELL